MDEDRLELWEIKAYHDRLENGGRNGSSKPGTPSTLGSTRTKSGLLLKQPEKYDPSPTDKEKSAKSVELMREQLETELKMQRAVHLSKRDNHPKNNNVTVIKIPTPTASQQLQQQQAAAGLPANPRSYGGGPIGGVTKKITVISTKTPISVTSSDSTSTPTSTAVGILNRSKNNTVAIPKIGGPQMNSPNAQKITVLR